VLPQCKPHSSSSTNLWQNERIVRSSASSIPSPARFLSPQTGDYIFVIASDDNGELWLGEEEDSETLIANVPRQWDKFPEQTSAPQLLAAGNYYFLMALAKEASGGDNLAVGVTLPDGTALRPIPVAGFLF